MMNLDRALEALRSRTFLQIGRAILRRVRSLVYRSTVTDLSADTDQMLDHCVAPLPEDASVMLLRGEQAIANKDWTTAAMCYQHVCDRFPNVAEAYAYGGWALWEAGRYDEADAILASGMGRFPDEPWIAIHYAFSARQRANWPEAARRYDHVRAKFRTQAAGYIEGGWALREAGRVIEADQVLQNAVETFPDEAMAWFHYGRNASALANWREAVRRWEACRARFPTEEFWRVELNQAYYEQEFAQGGAPDDREATAGVVAASDIDIVEHPRDVMMRFESIGTNCEFGLVQRHYTAEALGLLRFGGVPNLEFLIETIEQRFEGVGEPNNTWGEIGYAREHIILSKRGFSTMHSHVYESAGSSLDATVAKMLPRLKYLARKIVDDFEEASKIWVYKQFRSITDDEINHLHEALKRYNANNRLLCIRLPDSNHVEGSVELFDDKIAIGYIEFPEILSPGHPAHFEAWLKACRSAHAMLSVCTGGNRIL